MRRLSLLFALSFLPALLGCPSPAGGDAGPLVDAGKTADAGPRADAGDGEDAGNVEDAGPVDGGGQSAEDAGPGAEDAGLNHEDAGAPPDAGDDGGTIVPPGDAGILVDSGPIRDDAGTSDAGTSDAGPGETCATSPFPLPSPTVVRSGRYERIETFPMGDDLLARDLVVYLPASYDTAPERHYPVLYLHDGQNLFDVNEAAFHVEWQVDETVDALAAGGQIPEVIVVGIENTAERIYDYTPDVDPTYGGGGGDLYLDAVVERVKPFIDDRYRTRCGRSDTAIAGSSLGGLISFRALERHGDVFGRVGCLSSSFWWNGRSAVSRFSQSSPALPLRLWIDGGSEEGSEEGVPVGGGLTYVLADNRDVLARALDLGATYGETVALLEDPGAPHNEAAWAARLPSVLGWLLSDVDYAPEQASGVSVYTWAKRVPAGGRSAVAVELSFDGARVTWPASAFTLSLVPAGVLRTDVAGFVEADGEGAALVIASQGTLTGADVVQVGREGETAVGFEVGSPAASGIVHVAGNAAGLGSWEPAGLALTQGADGRWRGLALLPRDQAYEYKYTRGSWETVEKGPFGEEIANRTGLAGEPHVRRDEVATWASP